MQKLTYTNILGESVMFYNAPPFILEKIRGTGATENVITAIGGYQQDGDATYTIRKNTRPIDLSFHVEGRGRGDMYEKRRALSAVLVRHKAFNPATGQKARLVYENDGGQWWTFAVPEGGVTFDNRIRDYHYSIPLSFRCESPYWFAMAQKQSVLAYSDTGFELPFGFPVAFGQREFRKTLENNGQVYTPVEMTIEGQGETPVIYNHSIGVFLALTEPLPAGYTLYMNTDPVSLAVTVTGPDGTTENAYGYLDPETALTAFTLRPGLNDVEYLPGGTAAKSRITIKWYERFEGV